MSLQFGGATLKISERALAGMRPTSAARPAPKIVIEPERWNLIRTEPRRYAIAKQTLEREGFCVYVPMQKTLCLPPRNTLSQRQRRNYFSQGRWELRPWLPGYVFIPAGEWHVPARDMHELTGVIGPVTFGENLASMSAAAIAEIRKREANETLDVYQFSSPFAFKVNDAVQITDGPLMSWPAKVERVEQDREILNLLVNIFGRQTRVSLMFDQVEKL